MMGMPFSNQMGSRCWDVVRESGRAACCHITASRCRPAAIVQALREGSVLNVVCARAELRTTARGPPA